MVDNPPFGSLLDHFFFFFVSDANRRLVRREVVCLFTGVIERYLDFIFHCPACAATLCVVVSHPGARGGLVIIGGPAQTLQPIWNQVIHNYDS